MLSLSKYEVGGCPTALRPVNKELSAVPQSGIASNSINRAGGWDPISPHCFNSSIRLSAAFNLLRFAILDSHIPIS